MNICDELCVQLSPKAIKKNVFEYMRLIMLKMHKEKRVEYIMLNQAGVP